MNAGTLITTVLRHDRKVASYKIALIRSINDVVLGFPHIDHGSVATAIPLRIATSGGPLSGNCQVIGRRRTS